MSGVHHLIAHCRLLVRESATMATEAAILGVPAIYCGHNFWGYVRELERAGMLSNIRQDDIGSLPEAINAELSTTILAARDRYVANCPDWAEAVVAALDTSVCDRISG